MALQDTLKDTTMKVANFMHRTLITVSGGRIGSKVGDMPVVKLTTTGRKSGKPREVMLTSPVHDGDRWVLVASKGGDDRHPDWYRNLDANPEITLEPIDGDDGPLSLVARTASADEKAELWPDIVAAYKGYAGYAEKTDRDIPVVICEPAA